jgi:uncharacterized Fe-S center protein
LVSSIVYFADVRAEKEAQNLPNKVTKLFRSLEPEKFVSKGDLVAIKTHFGELGTNAFIQPYLVRKVVNIIIGCGGKPFLTDTNTLYSGSRHNAVDHINNAIQHGFAPGVVNAPVIIADGLTGKDYMRLKIDQKNVKYAHIGSAVHFADAFIALSHPTGHIGTGYGGALKNIGMGCGNRGGKQAMHSDFKPKINIKKCRGDGACVLYCPAEALKLVNKKAVLDKNKCIGCAECVTSCNYDAITINWDDPMDLLQEKIVEFAYAVLHEKTGKTGFINFVTSITPDCDCPPWSDAYLIHDVGILASHDPVALDKASIDLINDQSGNPNSKLPKSGLAPGADKFKALEKIDYNIQFKYAEELGLGNRKYKLVKI